MTLLAVVIGHVGVIALWLQMPPAVSGSDGPPRPLQLLAFKPPALPRIRLDDAVRRRWLAPGVPRVTLPVISAPRLGLMAPDGPAAQGRAQGRGAGVDWAAEARRALHAFEIRAHQQVPSSVSVAGEPGNDYWLRQLHHAGDQLKTAGGDWIIWTNADCYQIARADPVTAAPMASSPEVTCVEAIAPLRRDVTMHR